MNGHIYIAYLREFIQNGEDIYKIGKTEAVTTRPNGYPKGTIFLFTSYVDDINFAEGKIIEMLSTKTIRRLDYGKEYFEGDYKLIRGVMISIIDEINSDSRVKFIKSKIRLDDKKLTKKNDNNENIYQEYINKFVIKSMNDQNRIKQKELISNCLNWMKKHPVYQSGMHNFSKSSVTQAMEKLYDEVKSIRFTDEVTKGWYFVKFIDNK